MQLWRCRLSMCWWDLGIEMFQHMTTRMPMLMLVNICRTFLSLVKHDVWRCEMVDMLEICYKLWTSQKKRRRREKAKSEKVENMHSLKIGIILQFIELTFSYCHSISCSSLASLLTALKCQHNTRVSRGDDDDSIQIHKNTIFIFCYICCFNIFKYNLFCLLRKKVIRENVHFHFNFSSYYYEFSIPPLPLRNGSFPLFSEKIWTFFSSMNEMWNQFSGNGRVIVASNCKFFMFSAFLYEWKWTLSCQMQFSVISQMSAENLYGSESRPLWNWSWIDEQRQGKKDWISILLREKFSICKTLKNAIY